MPLLSLICSLVSWRREAGVSWHACVETEEMREQIERVLRIRLSDKAGKLSRACLMRGTTVAVMPTTVSCWRGTLAALRCQKELEQTRGEQAAPASWRTEYV